MHVLLILILSLLFRDQITRQIDRAIKRVRQSSVPPTQHHGADDDFAECREVAGEGSQIVGVAEGETDVAVCGDYFEEDCEDGESLCYVVVSLEFRGSGACGCTYIIFLAHDAFTFRDADTKHAEEDVPQVETELVSHMAEQIRLSPLLLIQCLVCAVDGDVHHDQETELNGWVHVGEIERRGSRVSGRRGLEQGGEDPRADG
jgi:hypothetical protein